MNTLINSYMFCTKGLRGSSVSFSFHTALVEKASSLFKRDLRRRLHRPLPTLKHLLVFLVCALPLTGIAQDRDLEVKGGLRTAIPQDLKGLHLSRPHAVILVEVDAEGELIDQMPFDATHAGLIDKALKVIKKAEFKAAVVEGEPTSTRKKVYVNFYDIEQEAWRNGGFMPQGGSVSDALERRLYEAAPEKFKYQESKVNELDSPLRMTKSTLRIYTSEEGVRQQGSCVVEYFVGPEGKVQFPRVIESDHADLSMSALLTLEVTEFEPPMRDGNSTFVKVQQPFNFRG